MRRYILILFLIVTNIIFGQTFTYSGYIYNAGGGGAPNVPVKLYKRTTPNLVGFTNQQNYNGHSYYRSTGSAFWSTAKTNCSNMGGHLVTVTTSAENSFIFGLWPSGWIGLTDEVNEGTWRWVTGESYSYTSWNAGEPNNAGNEDYVQFVGGGKWNDLPNSVSLPYVLEFEYIVGFTPWVLHQTVYTNSSGYYSFSQSTNPATEWYIQIDIPTTVTTITNNDAISANNKVISRTFNSLDYYRYDVNNDGIITISDVYYIYMKKSGRFSTWGGSLPNTRLFTQSQYNIINSSTSDLRSTYPGTSSITISTPTSGGSSSYYLINTGYSNSSILSY
jgi:hypothetical protein